MYFTPRGEDRARCQLDLSPLRATWSCYNGGVLPCRICDAGREREAAFEENGVIDPLLMVSGVLFEC